MGGGQQVYMVRMPVHKLGNLLIVATKRHILGRKHSYRRIDRADRSRNVTWARAEESKTRNSSRDEIANVNFLYDDIVSLHALQ